MAKRKIRSKDPNNPCAFLGFRQMMKTFDMFGHKVELNFDQKGSTHQTTCGGFVSQIFVVLISLTILVQFTVMRSRSQSLFYTHDYPLLEDEFADLEDEATEGIGVYLYFMDQTDKVAIPFESIGAYLAVSFVDGSGDSYAAVNCKASHFTGTKMASDPEKTIYESKANGAVSRGLICPSGDIASYDGLKLRVSACHAQDAGCLADTVAGLDWINSKVAVTKLFTRKVDFRQTAKSGIFYNQDHFTGYFPLVKQSNGRTAHYVQKIDLQLNQVEMFDGLMSMNKARRSYFLGIGGNSQYQMTDTKGMLLEQTLDVSDIAVKHNRRAYTFWMWLAMIGGITQSLLIAFNWMVAPFAKFGFQMRAYKRLYWARTSEDKLFDTKPDD